MRKAKQEPFPTFYVDSKEEGKVKKKENHIQSYSWMTPCYMYSGAALGRGIQEPAEKN